MPWHLNTPNETFALFLLLSFIIIIIDYYYLFIIVIIITSLKAVFLPHYNSSCIAILNYFSVILLRHST